MKRTRKAISILVTLAMLIGLLLPAGSAFAVTKNTTSSLKTVGTDFKGLLGSLNIKEDGAIKEDFENGKVFVVTLPDGVKFAQKTSTGWVGVTDGASTPDGLGSYDSTLPADSTTAYVYASKPDVVAEANFSSERTLTIKFGNGNTIQEDWVKINVYAIVDGAIGDIKLTIDNIDSGVSGGDIVIARTASGAVQGTVLNVTNIGEQNGVAGGVIRLTENTPGALSDGDEIKLKLPNGFHWVATGTGSDKTNVSVISGFGSGDLVPTITSGNDRELKIKYNGTGTETRGIIEIKPMINVDSDAKYGDVEVDLSGDNVDSSSLVIAKYGDYGVSITAKSTPEVLAGRLAEELGSIIIEENVDASMPNGRKLTLELPEFAKFDEDATISIVSGPDIIKDANKFVVTSSDKRKAEITIARSDAEKKRIKYEVKMKKINLQADVAGDVEVKVYGSAIGSEQTVVIAKAVTPVTVATVAKDVKLGVADQLVGDITITEAKAGAILDRNIDVAVKEYTPTSSASPVHVDTGNDGTVELSLPAFDGIKFSKTPKVEVTEGNLEIDSVVKSDKKVTIKVKSSSTKASTIKVSNVYLTVDRTVPVGSIKVNVGGVGIVQTYVGDDATKRDYGFDADTVTSVFPANVINPAPSTGSVLFTIGSTVYTVDGVVKVMDAAPYIKDSRTYVPVRYMALAMGVDEKDIAFENGVVTLKKGDTTLKMTIGDKNIDVNGSIEAMDVAPEINNGRTMLPARFVAEAFGAVVGFANGQVVISQN